MMTTESRAAQCCCCNARLTLIALLCFFIFIEGLYSIFGMFYNIYFLFSRGWPIAIQIFFLYGAVKRQSCILMTGFVLNTIGAVLVGIFCLLGIIMGSVFATFFASLANMDTSSGMSSGRGSSMSSQQQQQMGAMGAMATPMIIGAAIFMIVIFAIQIMICYLYFIVYKEAKRFQGSQVMVRTAGVVMQQGNYPNYPSYSTSNYPTPTPTYPTNYPPYGAKTATMA
ncbi:hypothetical protein WR25_03308 [Diploscapter pachys]|uniref:Uncharacterized protein n=1 Tax=Diploscapter pachys TaxID=2018661 RepID=A0A2A2L3E8_9BILA|nr:hypothetical protein WR25_03308 [Diploscapter pachys]